MPRTEEGVVGEAVKRKRRRSKSPSSEEEQCKRRQKSKKRQEVKKSKPKRKRNSSSSSTSDSDSSSSDYKKKKKKKKHKKKSKVKIKELEDKQKKSKHKTKDHSNKGRPVGPDLTATASTVSKGPMTKEMWEKQQNVIRRVFDPDTGRHRLVKGSGEIVEEIVSKERQKQINKLATQGDGISYSMQTGTLK